MAPCTSRHARPLRSHPPPGRARPKGQDASEARRQARPQVARSGARRKGDRKDYRSRCAARRTSPAQAPAHQGADRVSRGPRRPAEGEEMSPMVGNPPWAPEEDERLRALALSGASVAEMAKQMKRSEEAVRSRAYRLRSEEHTSELQSRLH